MTENKIRLIGQVADEILKRNSL